MRRESYLSERITKKTVTYSADMSRFRLEIVWV